MKKVNLDTASRKKKKVRALVMGTEKRPRISIFRSNRYIYGQAIDDEKRQTLCAASSLTFKEADAKKMKRIELSKAVGMELGKSLAKKKIKTAVFDRNIYRYLGHVKEFCEGIREAGIKI